MKEQIIQALMEIKNLPEGRGEVIFSDNDRFKSAINDFLSGQGRDMVGLRKRIAEAFELGAYVRLSKAAEIGDLDMEQLRVVAMLCADGIDETLAKDIVGAFAALFGSPDVVNNLLTQESVTIPDSTKQAATIKPDTAKPHGGKPAIAGTQPGSQPQPAPMSPTPINQNATGIAAEIFQGKTRNLQFGPYKWRVLDIQGEKALMITEDVIEHRPYNKKDTAVTWETCTLRKYLNGGFLGKYLNGGFMQKFSGEERGKIIETQISNPGNLWYGTPGGSDTMDKIFLLSLEEVDRYFGNSGDYQQKRRKSYKNGKLIANSNGLAFSNIHDRGRQAKFNNWACWWWLRSPGTLRRYAACVRTVGYVLVSGDNVNADSGGVRPAFWLNLKS